MTFSWMRQPLKRSTAFALICTALSYSHFANANESFTALPDITNRIIGGEDSASGQFPYIVGLVSAGNGDLFYRQFCGASIINQTWLLSAAHCFFDSNDNLKSTNSFEAVVGLTNLGTQGVVEYSIKSLFVHENYSPASVVNDIALIELNESLPASAMVAAVSLYSGTVSSLVGDTSTAIGWGATGANFEGEDPEYSHKRALQHVSLPLVSQQVCNESYQGMIPDTQLCAGVPQGGIDSCVGDSGGPLVITKNGETAQAGVVSYGYQCATAGYYGVYTNVGSYVDWIANIISDIRTVGADGVYTGDVTFDSNEDTDEPEVEPEAGSAETEEVAAVWWLVFGMAGIYLRRRVS